MIAWVSGYSTCLLGLRAYWVPGLRLFPRKPSSAHAPGGPSPITAPYIAAFVRQSRLLFHRGPFIHQPRILDGYVSKTSVITESFLPVSILCSMFPSFYRIGTCSQPLINGPGIHLMRKSPHIQLRASINAPFYLSKQPTLGGGEVVPLKLPSARRPSPLPQQHPLTTFLTSSNASSS